MKAMRRGPILVVLLLWGWVNLGWLTESGADTQIDVFTVIGQSNALGKGDSASSPSVDEAHLEYDGTDLSSLADPVVNADTGSAWPAFANSYYASTGRIICIVGAAVGSSALHPDQAGSNWSPSGDLTDDAVTKTQDAITALEAAGYDPVLRGLLWSQGEEDARNGVSKANYKAALIDLHERFETSLDSVGFFIFQLGDADDGTDPDDWQAIRDAQREAAEETVRMEMVFDGAVDFPDLGLMADNVHYTQEGYNIMGEEGGWATARVFTHDHDTLYSVLAHDHDDTYYTEAEVDALIDGVEGGGGSGEILISDTPSTPLVFADLVQNEDQDDLVYSD